MTEKTLVERKSMDEETQKIIKEKIIRLPKAIQQVILSADLTNRLQDIGRKNNLRIDQLGSLYTEVYLVLIGLAHPSDFVSNVKNSLGISNENAREVAVSINTEIFLPLREEIRKIYEEKQEKPAEPTQPSAFYNPPPIPSPKPLQVPPVNSVRETQGESVRSFLYAQTKRSDSLSIPNPSELPPPPTPPRAEGEGTPKPHGGTPSYIKDWEEENLNREDILKEIENPTLIRPKADKRIPNYLISNSPNKIPNTPARLASQSEAGRQFPNPNNTETETRDISKPKSVVPEPPRNLPVKPEIPVTVNMNSSPLTLTANLPDTRTMEKDIENMAVGLKNDKPAFPSESKPPTFSPTTSSAKPETPPLSHPSAPQSRGISPLNRGDGEENEVLTENLIARKLSQPAGAPREKSEYAMDPYREPIDTGTSQ